MNKVYTLHHQYFGYENTATLGYSQLPTTQGVDAASYRHLTEGFLKNRKTQYNIKFRIFNSLERQKQQFRDKITKNFYCKEGVIRRSFNSNKQLLLVLFRHYYFLKVLISHLLFFMFQFHIPFAKLWNWEHTVFTLFR